ncbi:site-specific DNA-methyltransferase [Devosia sp. 2618]|uniref:DNA-methyltransferase n=1 Tax=Devosia sp. 2618 TaxID=3156454 RepID=UPI003396D0B8
MSMSAAAQILALDDVTLWQGDCMDLMANIESQSVDLVLCDLPYGTTQNKWDSVLPLDALWAEYRRICRGAVVLTAQTPFDKVLGASNVDWLRYEWIWEKTEATGHLNAQIAPMKAHENVLVFYDRAPTYNPQKTSGHARKSATRRSDTTPNYGAQSFDPIRYDSTERFPRSVIYGPTDKQKAALHPTQKPVWLMEYFIRTYTNPGDVVLDNCMGSGTSGVACLQSGRRFTGIEQDAGYFRIAEDRMGSVLA